MSRLLLLAGFAIGSVYASSIGFVYSNGVFTDIPGLPGNSTFAYGINNAGQVVGTYNVSNARGFLFNNGLFATPFDVPSAFITGLRDINNLGQLTGYYIGSNRSGYHGFVYSGGTFTTLDHPLAYSTGYTLPVGINDAGQIAGSYNNTSGTHGFVYQNGAFTTLDHPLSFPGDTWVSGINDAGQIIGYYAALDGSAFHSFIYDGVNFTDIHKPVPGLGTQIYGINDAGQVVGSYTDGAGFGHAFLYVNGVFTDINPPIGSSGIVLLGINDLGQMVGTRTQQDVPLPEMPAAALTFSGVVAVFVRIAARLRRRPGPECEERRAGV